MQASSRIEVCCSELISRKPTVRRNACMEMLRLLDDKSIIEHVRGKGQAATRGSGPWRRILGAIQTCLTEDGKKNAEESRKTGTFSSFRGMSTDLFASFIRVAIKERIALDARDLLRFIFSTLSNSTYKQCFEYIFLKSLADHVLPDERTRSRCKEGDWQVLFTNIKELLRNQKSLTTEVDFFRIKCLMVTLKFGPLHSLPVDMLRDNFELIAKVCSLVSPALPTTYQETILELVTEFCKHCAKDNRLACCKLGETVFDNMNQLYNANGKQDCLKLRLVDFFNQQLTIHNPNGVTQGHAVAFAFNWDSWTHCVDLMDQLVEREVESIQQYHSRNHSVFVMENGVKCFITSFVNLFVAVTKQMHHIRHNENNVIEMDLEKEAEPPTKRRKLESSISGLIRRIQETKFWGWVHLSYSLIEFYPELMYEEEFLEFLHILSGLQVECKAKKDLEYHVYKSLTVLESAQNKLMISSELETKIKKLWQVVGDTTLKSVGLNNNIEPCQRLLQQLMQRRTIESVSLLRCIMSGTSNVALCSLVTLETAFENLPHAESSLKIEIIKWALGDTTLSIRCITEKRTADFLNRLTLKQVPFLPGPPINNRIGANVDLCAIEDVYFKTCFEGLIIPEKQGSRTANQQLADQDQIYNHDDALYQTLLVQLGNFIESCNTDCNLEVTRLLFNTICASMKYGFQGTTFDNLDELFNKSAKKTFAIYSHILAEADKMNAAKLSESVLQLNELFGIRSHLPAAAKLRAVVPYVLLQSFFQILRTEKLSVTQAGLDLKKNVVRTLTSFCCIPDSFQVGDIQHQAMESLIGDDAYSLEVDHDYEMVLAFFSSLKDCSPQGFNEDILSQLYSLFQKLCEFRYTYYSSALKILDIFYDIMPIFVDSDPTEYKTQMVLVLQACYSTRTQYGPSVSVALIRCMGLLHELDKNGDLAVWDDEEVILRVVEFLSSDHQEVRNAAVQTLAQYFSSSMKRLEVYHRQKIVFSKISEMSLNALSLKDTSKEDRRIDETVSRSASVLHTYASIIISCSVWVEEALFMMLKIAQDRNISDDEVFKVIVRVADHMGYSSATLFLEQHLSAVFSQWKEHDLETFPFQMYYCTTKVEFYAKYWTVLATTIMDKDVSIVDDIATFSGKSHADLFEECFAQLLSYCFALQQSNSVAIESNGTFKAMVKTLGEQKVCELLKNEIEETLYFVLEHVKDAADFSERFGRTIIFAKKYNGNLNVKELQEFITFIETKLLGGQSLFGYLVRTVPGKIHALLLRLGLKIDESVAVEDKLKYFQSYSIVIELIAVQLQDINVSKFNHYFARSVIYTLLHHIKTYKKQPELAEISCRFFHTVLQKLLPHFGHILRSFFLVTVSTLKKVALDGTLTEGAISVACTDVINLLVVQHGAIFHDEICRLDTFPNTQQFAKVTQVVQSSLREYNLEEAIERFLEFLGQIEGMDECGDGLRQLQVMLNERKQELKVLYERLRESRGFSEDCEKSLLHRLISVLIRLSCVTATEVSTEALRCLGEIGPADLATLVLQPEKTVDETKWTVWELVSGHVLSLLCKYIVDPNVKVIKVASDAIFKLLKTKEAVKVAGTFGFGPITVDYISPFFSTEPSRSSFNFAINTNQFYANTDDNSLWVGPFDHEDWIRRLVCSLLDTFEEKELFSSLAAVCSVKTEFCEQLLPLIVFTILHMSTPPVKDVLSQKIGDFFRHHWNLTVIDGSREVNNVAVNKASVQCMLNVVHFVRLHKNVKNAKRGVCDLDSDYIHVAKAAQFCTAHFTALLYIELWCRNHIVSNPLKYEDDAQYGCTTLDMIYKNVDVLTGKALHSILRNAFKAVGETDALSGCGNSFLLDPQFHLEHLKDEGRWDQVVSALDAQITFDENSAHPALRNALVHRNLYEVALFVPHNEASYECMWRLGRWQYCAEKSTNNLDTDSYNYEKDKYFALKCIHDRDDYGVKQCIGKAREKIAKALSDVSLESSKNLYAILAQLQALKEMEDVSSAATSETSLTDLVQKWKVQDAVAPNDFQYLEPIKAQRIILLEEQLLVQPSVRLKQCLIEATLDYAEYARIEGHSNFGSRALEKLRRMPELRDDVIAKVQFERAQLCWSIQDVITAKCIMDLLCSNADINPRLHAMALKTAGRWMAEGLERNRQTIIEDYFIKSINLHETLEETTADDRRAIVDTFNCLATFADEGYQQMRAHIKSEIFQKKVRNLEKVKQDICEKKLTDKQRQDLPKDVRKAIAARTAQYNIDQNEITNITTEKDEMLEIALKYYILNLNKSDCHNITIFRVVALLLENRASSVVQSCLNALLELPSYKFLDMLPQIVPHIACASGADALSETITDIVKRCSIDHPYHTLPLLLALAFSNKEREYCAKVKTDSNDARTRSATALLDTLKRQPKLREVIARLEFTYEALIELAYHQGRKDERSEIGFPKNLKINKVKSFDDVQVFTINLPVSRTGNYNKIIGIHSFGKGYHNVGGINAPKKIQCRGTDGIMRTQLVKGEDDLRQDAVMQQVFTIMNGLFATNKQTKNLLIRTYKIVPLSMRSGILEWVDNSMPLSEYLVKTHEQYRQGDQSVHKCKQLMSNSLRAKPEDKLRVFKQICRSIKPVFHKFFESSFPHPAVWYERRRAYIHSVATSSICGYILGIGDRHVSNILIDKSTAEVIHIDFGIAFEQGRILPTPETVPFRLTRDIVDGMGVSGVAGVFSRSCEKTVEVLRLNHQTILTILEVLLYDPLYEWTVSTAEANKRQRTNSNEVQFTAASSHSSDEEAANDVNVNAERALLRLRAKLLGTEQGNPTTVERQVGMLIQQAMDPRNLSRLYHGWQPFL